MRQGLLRLLDTLSMPLLAILTAFVLGGVVIWITSGSFQTVTVGAGPHTASGCRFKLKRTETTISGPISCP